MKKLLFLFLLIAILRHFSEAQQKIDLSIPPDTISLFQKGLISSPLYERDIAISPDGNELLYTVLFQKSAFSCIIYMSKDNKGTWSKPEVASFSGNYSDLEPAFSADGKRVYFASNRPVEGTTVKDFDIWFVEKKGNKWLHPKNLGVPVNTSANEFYPAIAENGNLYFTANYKKGVGKEDIYLAKFVNGNYSEPIALDTMLNSASFDEFNAYVSPDEQYILFSSQGRKDDTGRGDLYMSIKEKTGNWSPAKNLKLINSNRLDYSPFLSFDKKILFISSDRHPLPPISPGKPLTYEALQNLQHSILNGEGNIYWISFEKVLEFMKSPLSH